METELAAALEKLAQLLTAKNAENSSSSGAIVPQLETVQKLELMPILVKLEGVSNYLGWSRQVLLILKTKGLTGHVLGEVVEPADMNGADWQKWSATDSLIFAWMLNSLAPDIATSVEALPNAAAVWGLLSKRYSGKGNLMLMAQIESKVHDVRQGDRSVLAYVAELQQLWADLDQCDPLQLTHTESLAIAEAWIGRRRVMQYLKGLNPSFESRRATLLHQPVLCSLDKAITAMSQEEVCLQLSKGSSNESAYKVDEQRVWRETR